MHTFKQFFKLRTLTEKEGRKTIAVFPGSFKPPTPGHLHVVKAYSKMADSVIILISAPGKAERKTVKGTVISPKDALDIWSLYLKAAGISNAKVIISDKPSPITAAYNYINDSLANVDVILGASKKDDDYLRWKNAAKFITNDTVTIKDPKSTAVLPLANKGVPVSATSIRDNLDKPEEVKAMLPAELSSRDKELVLKILGA